MRYAHLDINQKIKYCNNSPPASPASAAGLVRELPRVRPALLLVGRVSRLVSGHAQAHSAGAARASRPGQARAVVAVTEAAGGAEGVVVARVHHLVRSDIE